MIFGILSSQSCMLSEISRKLNEKTSVKKIIDRLSRNLGNFNNGEILFGNYLKAIKSQIDDKTILIVDGSDITKDYTTKMEGIQVVRDGSTGEYKLGYHTLGISALTPEKKMPIPVYSRVYSATESGFVSEDEETIKGLRFLSNHFKRNNIRAFDRGYDNNKYYAYIEHYDFRGNLINGKTIRGKGSIGKYQIEMSMHCLSGQISGWYKYKGHTNYMTIKGTITDNDYFNFVEYNDKGERFGTFTGYADFESQTLSGSFHKGSVELDFRISPYEMW